MKNKLKPCPFCGSRRINFRASDNGYFHHCPSCGACGPFIENLLTDEMQEEVWNRRDGESVENAFIALSAETRAVIEREQTHHRCQSRLNVCKWGLQNAETLILAIAEQTGKLSQAFLHSDFEPEKYTPGEMLAQTRHTAALCLQLAIFLESTARN